MRKSRVKELVSDAKFSATCQTASFSINPEEDAKIKEAIKLYMDTWVVKPLEMALEELERK